MHSLRLTCCSAVLGLELWKRAGAHSGKQKGRESKGSKEENGIAEPQSGLG